MRAYEIVSESYLEEINLKQSALVAALISALATPVHGQELVGQDVGKANNPVAAAIGIIRSINKMKDYGAAGLEGEAHQEMMNVIRAVGGHPDQSRTLPIIKRMMQDPTPIEVPQQYQQGDQQ